MNREKKKIFLILFLFNLFIFKIKFFKKIDQENHCLVEKYRSKLFCFILISEKHFYERAQILFETWGKRCGTFRFVLQFKTKEEKDNFLNENHFPIIELSPSTSSFSSSLWNSSFDDNYTNLAEKLRQTIFHLYSNYNNYFWYLKADDDTFIIIENLLRLLISKTKKSLLYGYRFREGNYVSGGAGYVLTNQGISLFNHYLNHENKTENIDLWNLFEKCQSKMEDQMIGFCLEEILNLMKLKKSFHSENLSSIQLIDETIDENGAERFHPLSFYPHFKGLFNKTKRQWIHYRPFHPNLFGDSSISETTISFHYTTIEEIYEMDLFIYEIRQYDRLVCSRF